MLYGLPGCAAVCGEIDGGGLFLAEVYRRVGILERHVQIGGLAVLHKVGIVRAFRHVLMGKTGQISHDGIQLGRIVLAGRCQHLEHCRFFQPVSIKGNGHRLCADLGHILRGIDGRTGAVHHFIRIERVDVHICHPPAGFRLVLASAPVQPRRPGGVHLVVVFLGI